MSLRSFSFSGAMQQLRAERLRADPVYVVAGRYDRATIMREAVKVARTVRAGGASWQLRMKVGLQTVWELAREAMAAATAATVATVPAREGWTPRPYVPGVSGRSRGFIRGSRIHSHGW